MTAELESVVEKIVSRIIENSGVYFSQNFEGSIVCCSRDQLIKDIKAIMKGVDHLNVIAISFKEQVSKIEHQYSAVWRRKKAKLELVDKLSHDEELIFFVRDGLH